MLMPMRDMESPRVLQFVDWRRDSCNRWFASAPKATALTLVPPVQPWGHGTPPHDNGFAVRQVILGNEYGSDSRFNQDTVAEPCERDSEDDNTPNENPGTHLGVQSRWRLAAWEPTGWYEIWVYAAAYMDTLRDNAPTGTSWARIYGHVFDKEIGSYNANEWFVRSFEAGRQYYGYLDKAMP
jgi:hypothetical protein